MMRCAHLCLSLAWLGVSAYAAEPNLTIELRDVELVLPSVAPPHFQKEGLPYLTENEFVIELLMLIGNQEYEAALALAREHYPAELALVEAGDSAGALGGRAGPGRLPIPVAGGNNISATVLYLIGTTYLALERYAPAEAALRAALVPLPDYLRVHEALAILLVRTERFEEARVHLARAAELGLNTAALHASLGYINAQVKNWWGALSAYQQAVAIEHDNRNWQTGVLQALNETQQYGAGLALVEQLLPADPDNRDLWLYRAHMALNSDQREFALTSLETAIRLGDDSVANKQVAAALHMERGSLARAVDLLKGAAAEDLDFQFLDQALAWLEYANEWDYYRDLFAAAEGWRSPLTELERSRVLVRKASLELHDGNRQAAITSLQQAVQLDASNGEALMTLGQAYRDERDYNRATLMFQRAGAFDLHRDNASISLAQLAIDQEDFERALALLRDVVSRNPARTDLLRNVDTLENLVLARTGN
jgi:tetratricopeptide (TPR) repeat protein